MSTTMTETALRAWGNREDALNPHYGDRTSIQKLRKEFAHIALGDAVGSLLDKLHDAFGADDRAAMVRLCATISTEAAKDQRPVVV